MSKRKYEQVQVLLPEIGAPVQIMYNKLRKLKRAKKKT